VLFEVAGYITRAAENIFNNTHSEYQLYVDMHIPDINLWLIPEQGCYDKYLF